MSQTVWTGGVDEQSAVRSLWAHEGGSTTVELAIERGWTVTRTGEACLHAVADGLIWWAEDPTGVILWFVRER